MAAVWTERRRVALLQLPLLLLLQVPGAAAAKPREGAAMTSADNRPQVRLRGGAAAGQLTCWRFIGRSSIPCDVSTQPAAT